VSLAGALLAVTLSVGAPSTDTLDLLTQFPPALEPHPSDPNTAFVGISSNGPGVFGLRIAPAQALDYTGVAYQFPGGFNCSESSPFNTPNVGGFSLERGSGVTRGWLTTSSCELAVPFNYATGAGINVLYSGQSRSAVPTRFQLNGSFTRYQNGGGGAAISNFKTNFTASAVTRLRVPLLLISTKSSLVKANVPAQRHMPNQHAGKIHAQERARRRRPGSFGKNQYAPAIKARSSAAERANGQLSSGSFGTGHRRIADFPCAALGAFERAIRLADDAGGKTGAERTRAGGRRR
jgi:hypothetical protein